MRQCLREIRVAFKLVQFNGFAADKFSVTLDHSLIDVDILRVIECARTGCVHPTLMETERLGEQLLGELEAVDPAFDTWLLTERQAVRNRISFSLEAKLRELQLYNNIAASAIAHALLNLEPTHEEAARALMRSYAEAGNLGGALWLYRKLRDLLETEYDVRPSPETQALISELKSAADAVDSRGPMCGGRIGYLQSRKRMAGIAAPADFWQ